MKQIGGVLAALLSVMLIGCAFAFVIAQEPPTGKIVGRVLLPDGKTPLRDVTVRLYPTEDERKNRNAKTVTPRRALTRSNGSFVIGRIAAGEYYASVTTAAHEVSEDKVVVRESQTTNLNLRMKRTEPDLRVAQHQRIFTPAEPLFLPVRGYLALGKTARADTLHVTVYRARLSDLLNDEAASQALSSIGRPYDENPTGLPKELLHPSISHAPKKLYDADLSVDAGDREGFFTRKLPIKTQGVGAYLVNVTHGNKAVCSWLLQTRMALVLKRAPDRTLAYAADIVNGHPIPATEIKVFRQGKSIATQRTDSDGLSEMPAWNGEGSTPTLVVARRGDDEAVLRQNNEYEDTQSTVIHTYTDRPIYRPGHTISYKGIIRTRAANGFGYDLPTDAPITVAVRDPNGDPVYSTTHTANANGSYFGSFTLSPQALTGTYSLITLYYDKTSTTEITVAAYRKPEFAATVTTEKPRYIVGETGKATVDAKYYFGAPLAGAHVRYYVYRSADWSADYGDEYDAESEERYNSPGGFNNGWYGENVAEGEATLDENGKATINFPTDSPRKKEDSGDKSDDTDDLDNSQKSLKTDDPPQSQEFKITATVTDDAKRESEATYTAHVYAGNFLLSVTPEGYVAQPGKPSGIIVTARDPDGKPIAGRRVDLRGEYPVPISKDKNKPQPKPIVLTTSGMTGADGRALLQITPTKSGELRLTATAEDDNHHKIVTNGYLWAAGSDNIGDLQTEYADLSILTDKKHYQPGDTARVLVNAARTGQSALVTVEGDRIYSRYLVTVKNKSTVLQIPIRREYGPNITFAACYVRDKKFAQSAIGVRVALPNTEIKVGIVPDKPKHEPGENVSYVVTTTDTRGKPIASEFSLGVVDESIYALRGDDPGAIRKAFFPKRQNRVSTNYSFAVEYLGDGDKSEPKIEARTKFLDTAFWKPDLHTDSSGKATVTVPLPDNLTTWRATAIACDGRTSVGWQTDKIVVSKPFFVRLEMPRFVTQGDKTRLLALVHNETGTKQTAMVRLVGTGIVLNGDDTRTLTLESGAVGQAEWNADATTIGDAKLRATVWIPEKTAAGRQYTDGVELPLTVRPYGRDRITTVSNGIDGATANADVTVSTESIPAQNRMTIRLTPSIGASLSDALAYVIDYPYGCVEQTTSRFLPLIIAQSTAQKIGTNLVADANAKRLPDLTRDGLARLARLQRDDGAWGWWERDTNPDPFMTAYALFGLSNAKAQGYPVSERLLAKGREAAAKLLPKARNADKPFLLYAIALAGDLPTARRERAHVDIAQVTSDGLTYLALLDKRLGGDGGQYMGYLQAKMVTDGPMVYWKTPATYWNGGDRTATALALMAYLECRPTDRNIPRMVRWLMQSRTEGYWGNTRDTAFAVYALCSYLQKNPNQAGIGGSITVKVNGKSVETVDVAALKRAQAIVNVPADTLKTGQNRVVLERADGQSGTLFYTVSLRQTIATKGELPAMDGAGITVKREYLRILPKKIGASDWKIVTEPMGESFAQGDRLHVKLTIVADREIGYALVEDAYPAGCEPNERGSADTADGETWNNWYDGVDVRDDRIAFFARTLPKGKSVVEYNLRAQTPGTFHALPTKAQAMYIGSLTGESDSQKVTVRP